MKKWLIGLLVLLLVLVGFTYVFIPGEILVHSQATIKFPRTGLERVLFNDDSWKKWFPSTTEKEKQDTSIQDFFSW